MKKRTWFLAILCTVLIGALIAGCGGGSSHKSGSNPTPVPTTPGGDASSWIETFNNVPAGTNIQADQSTLDNPTSFTSTNMLGPTYVGTTEGGAGSIALDNRANATDPQGANSLRIAFTVPGLGSATAPLLKLTIKNLNAATVTLFIGDSYGTASNSNGSGQKAHGTVDIPSSSTYSVVSVNLNTGFTNTNMIQFRPTVIGSDGKATSNNAGGIYIDKVEVTGVPSGSNGTPSPTPTTVAPTPTPTSTSSVEPTPTSTVAPTPTPTTTAPPSGLPSGWSSGDIGTGQVAGSLNYNAGTFSITGSGNQLSTASDNLYYVYTSITGDFTATVRLTDFTGTGTAKAGLMARNSLDAADLLAAAADEAGASIRFRNRTAPGNVGSANLTSTFTLPIYLTAVRAGNVFKVGYSTDGQTYSYSSVKTIGMNDTIYLGLFVNSGSNSTSVSATFDSMTVNGITVSSFKRQSIKR